MANALDLTDRVLPRLQAQLELKPTLLNFVPYTKDQIVEIIENRLEQVSGWKFLPDEDSVAEKCMYVLVYHCFSQSTVSRQSATVFIENWMYQSASCCKSFSYALPCPFILILIMCM